MYKPMQNRPRGCAAVNGSGSYNFRSQGRKSSWILTKLDMMDDYRSVMMHIVWGHGLMPTAVLVH